MLIVGVDYDTKSYHIAFWDGSQLYTEHLNTGESDKELMTVASQTAELCKKLNGHAYVEMPIHIQNPNTTIKLTKVFSFLYFACLQQNVPFSEIRIQTWKKETLGKGSRVNKQDVFEFARNRWGEIIDNQHFADASCIALAGHQIESRKEDIE